MSSAATAPQPGRPAAVLNAAVTELRTALPFDAMQLLRHDPRRATVGEALRVGYSPDAAWALQHLFVEKYRVGFTQTLSPNDGLPPAISSVQAKFRDDFVESRIFRDHLQRQGYRDGISMELFLREEYVGIAHFSSRAHLGFTEESRRAASSVRGLLAALILDFFEPGSKQLEIPASGRGTPTAVVRAEREDQQTWQVISATRHTPLQDAPQSPTFVQGDRFIAHLAQFRASGLAVAQHLWLDGATLYRVELRALRHSRDIAVGVSPAAPAEHFHLTVQELRVITFVCTGLDDASIAVRLHLSRRTVESHVLSARRKLGAKNRVEAVVRALTTASTLPHPEECPLHVVFGMR